MRVWIHPTRDQLETGWRQKERFEIMKRKVQQRLAVEPFAPVAAYHAVVVLGGVHRHAEDVSMRTALRLLMDCPLGFDLAMSYTFHLVGGGRPMIGLVAADRQLDRKAALAHFADCGVVPEPSGQS